MSSFDGLVEARAKQLRDVVRRSYSRPIAGSDRVERETTGWQKALGILGIGEEVVAKTLGTLLTDNPRLQLSSGIGKYNTNAGFADLFRETGLDPTAAAILGIATAIANPLDPLNKLKIGQSTKLGKAADAVTSAGGKLEKGADELYRISRKQVEDAINTSKREIDSGVLHPDVAEISKESIARNTAQLANIDELNSLLVDLQKQGIKVNELSRAGSFYDAVRTGQKHLIGFSSPFKMDQLSLFGIGKGYTADASVFGLSGPKTAALVKSVTGLKTAIVKPISDAAYAVADKLGIQTIRGEKMQQLNAKVKSVLDSGKATVEETERDLLSVYKQFLSEYGPQGADAAKNDLLTVLQQLEVRQQGGKEVAIELLGKLNDYKAPSFPRGKGAVVEKGAGLSEEQKLRLAPSGIDDAEIPVAVSQFDQAHTPSVRIGKNGAHEVKILGKYVVVKTSDPVAATAALDDLDGVFGNRNWAKHEKNGETYLMQKRHPGAVRITNASQFQPEHLKNLEVIAAQLANKQKGFVNLKPEDILVSPSGAVQIINPNVIAQFKASKNAVANSRTVLNELADTLGMPKGTSRELPYLKNTHTARSVPRGLDGLTFRSAAAIDVGPGVLHVPAHDLLEQAVNTDGFKQYVRASYDQVSPQELANLTGDAAEFERANNIEYYRNKIRESVTRGETPQIEPIAIVKDDLGNLHIANGRDRLTASILEGYEAVPVYERNFIGEVAKVENGFYRGATVRLKDIWNPYLDSSAANVANTTNGVVATNYSLVDRAGKTVKISGKELAKLDPRISPLLNRLVTAGPLHSVGKARNSRLLAVEDLLKQNFGNMRNALIAITEMAEQSPDIQSFVQKLEGVLVNKSTGQGIRLDNTLRHPDAASVFTELKDASSNTLDHLAKNGVFTPNTVKDLRRLSLASDDSDLVVKVLDENLNTLHVVSNQATTAHLKTVAESWIARSSNIEDVEPYARIQLIGSDGNRTIEAKDLVTTPHPKIAEVLHNQSVFTVSKQMEKQLNARGIFVATGKNNAEISAELEKRGFTKGVLLGTAEKNVNSTKTGKFIPGRKEEVIVRPEYTFFVTRSGSVVIGTKEKNVKDLIESVFEEGPAYFEEFGVMTTGKVVVSNPFGSKMSKIAAGEIRQLQDRITTLAEKFKALGFSEGTVLDIKVPFDDAVWRSMYGERVTIGDILSDNYRIKIPDNLKGYAPDIRVLAPGRVGAQGQDLGIVGLEKTRLANQRMQDLFNRLADYGDKLFLDQAKAGLPISYYASWFGRHLTKDAREALNKAWLDYANKESKTFKHLEPSFKERTLTDLTTQEVNSVISRLRKEGEANVESIISDVVAKMRSGYKINPTKETAAALVAIAKITPEGLDFFHLDPIFATALSARNASRAIARNEIVNSLKESGVAIWNGSVRDLNAIKIGKNKEFAAAEKAIGELNASLTQKQNELNELLSKTPDLAGTTRKAELESAIDSLTQQLAKAHESKVALFEKASNGKVLDTMVDLESEHVWIRGQDMQNLVEQGIIKASDVIGDPSDALVRLPIKKYASELDSNKAEIFLFPKEVLPVVQRYFGTTTKEGFNSFLQLWDTVHATWRAWTLFPIPSYHVRNAVGNLFQAYIGGVNDARAYQEAFGIMQIIDGHRKGALTTKQVTEALGTVRIASVDGKVYTGQQIYDAFVQHGGLAGGLHYNEFNSFGNIVRQSEFEKLTVKAGLRPSSELSGSMLMDNTLLRYGVSASAYVENRMRLSAFIDSLVKGHTQQKGDMIFTGMEAAAMRMKSIYYDYSDLSAFERSWLRRVIPFYSWSRHNIPRMLETLVTDPIKHYRLAEFFNAVETGAVDGPRDENTVPDWIKARFGIITEKLPNGNYVMKVGDGFLPMIDAYKMLAGQGITRMIKDGMTPFVKVPIEQLLNYSMYSEKPIEQVAGQRAQSFTLGSLGFSRRATTEGPLGVLNLLLNESMLKTFFRPGAELTSKIIDPIFDGKEGPSIKLGIYALMLGKFYEIDPQQARRTIYSSWTRQRSQLMGLRNDAYATGDMKSVEDADRMMAWLSMQYPGDKEL